MIRSYLPALVFLGIGAALGLIFYNGVIDRPGEPSAAISVKYGWFLALLAALVMTVASAMRSSAHERARKPPGTI